MKNLCICLIALSFLLTVNATQAGPRHWTSRYPRFGGVLPRAVAAETYRELFEGTVIKEVNIKAPGLMEAVPQFLRLVEESERAKGVMPVDAGISCVISEVDHGGYKKALRLQGVNLSIASVIDSLAAQGDFYWDFSRGPLTLRATRENLLGKPKATPTRRQARQ